MNAAELAHPIAEDHEISVAKAAEVIADIFAKIKDTVNGGDSVEVDHFGRFINRARGARVGRNPATGETINVAASSSVGFIPSNDE